MPLSTLTLTNLIHRTSITDHAVGEPPISPFLDKANEGIIDALRIKHTDHFYEQCSSFSLLGRTFEELPDTTQKFLVRCNLWPREYDDFPAYFAAIAKVRIDRRNSLARTLEGVSRAIVSRVMESEELNGKGVLDEVSREDLVSTLQPEWKSHLDNALDEIDALIWLDMTLCRRTGNQRTLAEYIAERRMDVENMVDFALHRMNGLLRDVKAQKLGLRLLSEEEDPDEDSDGPHISEAEEETEGY